MTTAIPLKTLTASQLADFAAAQGWPRYRARQILAWIYRRGATRFDQMTDLGRADQEIGRAHV